MVVATASICMGCMCTTDRWESYTVARGIATGIALIASKVGNEVIRHLQRPVALLRLLSRVVLLQVVAT
jgi:hypothetical protein